MDQGASAAPELWWLGLTGILMVVLSLPYVTNRIFVGGLWSALDNPQPGAPRQSGWAERMKAAHYNSVENLVVFGPLAVGVVVAGVNDGATALAAALFFWSRLAYVIIYSLGIPVARTLAFLVGWLCSLYLALALIGIL